MTSAAIPARALWGAGLAFWLSCGAPAASAQGTDGTVLTLQREGETVELSLADLEAMPQHEITTDTQFTDRPVSYKGPLAREVLERLDLSQEQSVRVVAINDYFIDVPTSDFREYDVILALKADGRMLSRRDKGPLWLMYPISDFPALSDPIYNARLIWQVLRIEAL